MKTIDNFEPHLKHVLKEMCSLVGANPAKIDFKAERWFMDYEWVVDLEQVFITWLTEYLRISANARKEFLAHPHIKTKHNCKKAAEEFVWNYGWKTKIT